MSTPQRYSAYHSGDPSKVGLWENADGEWVLYTDHVATCAALEARILDEYANRDYDGLTQREHLQRVRRAADGSRADALDAAERLVTSELNDPNVTHWPVETILERLRDEISAMKESQ